MYAAYKRLTSDLKTQTDWKWGDGKKISHAKGNAKKPGVAILILDKVCFKTKTVKRENGHYIMIKGSIPEEDITKVNIYKPNVGHLNM